MKAARITIFALGAMAMVSGAYHLNAYLDISSSTGEPGFGYRWPMVALWGSVSVGILGVLLMTKATVLWNRLPLGMLRTSIVH